MIAHTHRRFSTRAQQLARESIFICIFCLLMLVLPAEGHWDLRSIRSATIATLRQVQDEEFLRWSRNEVSRRSSLRRHLVPQTVTHRRVLPLRRSAIISVYSSYAVMLVLSISIATVAMARGSLAGCRWAWRLIAVASVLMCSFLVLTGWPAIFFSLLFVTFAHIFFGIYALSIIRLTRVIEQVGTVRESMPSAPLPDNSH